MSVWLFFALLAPCLFGLANIFDKVLTNRFSPVTLNIFSGLFTGLFLPLFLFVGHGMPTLAVFAGLAAGAFWFLGGFPYFMAVRIEDISRVVPLWQLTVPMTLIFAILFLGERLSLGNYAALAMIFCGAFLVSMKDLRKTLRITPAFWLMVLAAFIITISSIITKRLYAYESFWDIQLLLMAGNFAAAAFSLAFFSRLRKVSIKEVARSSPGLKALLAGRTVVELLAYVSFNIALLTGPVSLTMVLDGLSGFFVFIVATLVSLWWPALFREELDRKTLLMKAVAIGMIFTGLLLVGG
ncbi:TPA: EamA family transporter [Candidatus Woesearchaeota archaeon]|nr:EamA family transporter [Candidatus Woesearchaeota archaeon]